MWTVALQAMVRPDRREITAPMTETRQEIHAHVRANAGVHFNELVRESAFAPGRSSTTSVDCSRTTDSFARVGTAGRTTRPPSYDAWSGTALALFRRETTREIVTHLIEREPAAPADVADALGVARSTLEYHLDRLVDHEIVDKRYDEQNRVVLTLADPDTTGRLLTTVTPTVPDRLIDRFTRLVDELLAGTDETQ